MASLGKDLASIRAHLGYTIQDIQNATKIPLNTLQSIENGTIFDQSDEIKTYVRSFVRSYGRALKLDDEKIVTALNQQEAGKYNYLLLEDYPELYEEVEHLAEENREELKQETKPKEQHEKKPEEKTPATGETVSEENEKKSESKASEFKPAPDPGVRNVNWADMGRRFSIADQKSTSAWIIGAVVIILLILAAAYFLFENDFFTSENLPVQEPVPEQINPQNETRQGLQLEITDSPSGENQTAAELDETLYLMIYAAIDKLEPVRVWSDLKPRIDPYWLDQGTAFNFEFSDTIRVRGQYSRMLLFLNGHRIDNFRQNYFNPEENAVELTRSLFEDDPRWASPIPLELPENIAEPDTVTNRPSF